MDATTPPRGDEPTGAQPADPSPQVEPAHVPGAGGSSPLGSEASQAPAQSQQEAAPAHDDGPEDPTVPDTAVEATLATEPARGAPDEPVVPTSAPGDARIATPQPEPEPEPEPSRPTLASGTADTQTSSTPPVTEPGTTAERSRPGTGAPAAEPAQATPSAPPAAPAQGVVYVAAPTPPKKKGNRGVGVLLAALSTLLFLGIYVAIVVLINALQGRGAGMAFLEDLRFYIPVLLFAVGFILLAAIVNRAGWWSFVLGSFFVGAFVYFGYIGLLLLSEASTLTSEAAVSAFRSLLISPLVIAAGVVAREVALWVGAAISARGRRIKAKNAEARAEFDREQAEHQAEIERTGAVVRPA